MTPTEVADLEEWSQAVSVRRKAKSIKPLTTTRNKHLPEFIFGGTGGPGNLETPLATPLYFV